MIGIFDSGVGGLTVLKEIRSLLPMVNLFYLGDTAYFPYGTKSAEEIVERALWCSRFLEEKGAEMIVVACNTASACAINKLQAACLAPVIGMIEPLVEELEGNRIGLLATQATIAKGAYQVAISKKLPHATFFSHAAPELVEMVELGIEDKTLIQRTLSPLKKASLDTLILGCTHFSLLKEIIAEEMGPKVRIREPGPPCVNKINRLISLRLEEGTTSTYMTGLPTQKLVAL